MTVHKMEVLKKGKKCISILACCMFILILMTVNVGAQARIKENPETGYQIIMDDMADLLTGSEENSLLYPMEEISAFGNVAFVSVEDHPYRDEFEYASEYYHSHFDADSGTIMIIDMKLRKITVFSDGDIYKTVTKSYATTITDNIYTYASDGDYFTCANKAFEQILKLLNGKRIAQPMKYTSNILLAMILALLVNYIRAIFSSGANRASDQEWLEKLDVAFDFSHMRQRHTGTTKEYNPQSSSSGGSSGGGGGGSSGGGGSHSF